MNFLYVYLERLLSGVSFMYYVISDDLVNIYPNSKIYITKKNTYYNLNKIIIREDSVQVH